MSCGCLEVLICGQEDEIVSATELNQQGIDGPDLHPAAATGVAHLRRFNVILPVWLEESESGEAFYELHAGLRPRKALQEFLQDEPGCEDLI